MRFATWNVNGIRPRKDQILALLAQENLDLIALQETKIADDIFPVQDFADAGYAHQMIVGQKAHHGVAILSRVPFADQGRWVFAGIDDKRHGFVQMENGLRLHCLYVPSGRDKPDPALNPKFDHKMRFLAELEGYVAQEKDRPQPMDGRYECCLPGK